MFDNLIEKLLAMDLSPDARALVNELRNEHGNAMYEFKETMLNKLKEAVCYDEEAMFSFSKVYEIITDIE